MSASLLVCQVAGFILQTFPVAVLFFTAVPPVCLSQPVCKILKKFFGLLLGASLGFTILSTWLYIADNKFYQFWDNCYMGLMIAVCIALAIPTISMEWQKILISLLLVIQYEAVIVNLNSALLATFFIKSDLYLAYEPRNIFFLLLLNILCFPFAYVMMNRVVRRSLPYIQGDLSKRGCVYVSLSVGIYCVTATVLNESLVMKRLIMLGIVLVCNLITYIIYFSEISLGKRQMQIEEQMRMITKRYQLIQENIENTKRARHDMRHELNLLRSYYEKGDINAIGEYLRMSDKHLDELEKEAVICDYPILDTILRYYINFARHSGISVRLDIHVHKEYDFDLIDITSLVGNFMENAIEASQQVPEEKRYINLHIRQSGQLLLMLVENSCWSQESVMNGEFLEWDFFQSTKRQSGEGMGLRSMSMIAEKYGGMVIYKKEHGQFTTKISLKIPEDDRKGRA